MRAQEFILENHDYMAGHCHVMALALKRIHPNWQLRAHIGWDEDAEDDDDYRVDHVYAVAPDGAAYDCRGRFDSEQQLVGPNEVGVEDTQFVDMDWAEIKRLIWRGELKPFDMQDVERATSVAKQMQLNEVGNTVTDYKRRHKNSLFQATVDGHQIDVEFNRHSPDGPMELAFRVDQKTKATPQNNIPQGTVFKIFSTVLNVIKQQLPGFMKKAHPPAVYLVASGANRINLYRRFFFPAITEILGPGWQLKETHYTNMSQFRWEPVEKPINEQAVAPVTVYHGNQGGIHRELITPMWWTEDRDTAEYYATQGGADGYVYSATLTCKNPYMIVKGKDEPNDILQKYASLIEQGYDSIHDPRLGDWIPFHARDIHVTGREDVDGDEQELNEAKTVHYNGLDISIETEDDVEGYLADTDDETLINVTASSHGRELGHVLFAFDGEYLTPEDLEVDERYRGQGIAATMYDYVKTLGYKIRRNPSQTAAGTGFWDRHRPGKTVWEQQELDEIGNTRPEYTRPDKQRSGKHRFTTQFTGARGKQRQVDVYFMYDYNTLEIDFKVDGRVNSYVTGGGDAVLILSAVRHIVGQELPKILKRIPRLKQVRFRSYAEEQSRVSLYLNRAVPMVSRILGPDWRYYGDFMTMGDSHWFYWQHRTVTGMDRVRAHGQEPQEQPDEPYDVGETERFRQAWEKKQQQGVAEGLEQINEYRDRLLQYVKSLLPTWPDYVLKDWLVPNKGNFSNLPADAIKNGIMEKLQGAGLTVNTKWQLVPDMKFTMDMFDPMTKQRLIGRAGGHSDLGLGIPRDKERHATQAALAKQQGGVRKEPVLLIKTPRGYELLEGWHRTIQHFASYPDGYVGPAYVAVSVK